MREALLFWLAAQGAALASVPLCYRFFSRLPDRGYAFSKPLGVVATAYVFWLGGMLKVWPAGRGSVLLALLLVAAASLALLGPRRADFRHYLRGSWQYIVVVECLFLSAFLFAVYLRSFVPELIWGEKPFELAFLNSAVRGDSFPPRDPWLAGHSINYYYFGYVEAAALTHLSGLGTNVTFWLMLCLVAAMAAMGAFGLGYNLAALRRGGRGDAIAVLLGLAASGLLLLVGNLAGVFELMARHGVGGEGLYRGLGIAGLAPYDCVARPQDCRAWYPAAFWWWWKATRMGSAYEVQEFPIFSFQFGDLHPHVLALPTTLAVAGVGLQLLLDVRAADGGSWLDLSPWRLLAASLAVAAVAMTDMWALATFLSLVAGTVGVGRWAATGSFWQGLAQGLVALVVIGLGVALLCLPFFLTVQTSGLAPAVNQAWVAKVRGYPPLDSAITRPLHMLLFWLPVLVLPLGYLLKAQSRPGGSWLGVLPWGVPLAAWASFVLVSNGVGSAGPEPKGFLGEVAVRAENGNWLTLAMLVLVMNMAGKSLGDDARDAWKGQVDTGRPFVSWLVLLALMLLLGAELFYVRDLLGFRYNTVFRFWYHAWTLLAVTGAYAAYDLLAGMRLPSLAGVGRAAWMAFSACVVGGGLVFTVLVVAERTEGLSRSPRGLDALAYLAVQDPEEYQAIRWLAANIRGMPVVLEATGGPYSDFGRVSSRTGLPTVLGWANHEVQWRGGDKLLVGRSEDIRLIYETTDIWLARALLAKYDVEYVVVGRVEREAFVDKAEPQDRAQREAALAKFADFMEVAFRSGNVTIYRLPRELYRLTS